MKKAVHEVPTDSEIRLYDNVPVEVACRYIGWSTPTLYRALQESRAPFGFAVKNEKTNSWTYNISPGLLVKYKRGDLPTYRLREVENLAVEGIERIIEEKLSSVRRIMEALT